MTYNESIKEIFSNLTEWRNIPGYRLEPHADVFIGLYIVKALQKWFVSDNNPNTEWRGIILSHKIIPEFPISAHLGDQQNYKIQKPKTRHANRIDYAVFSDNSDDVFFIELKTDPDTNINTKYIDYVNSNREISQYVSMIMYMSENRKYTSKYRYLLKLLNQNGIFLCSDQYQKIAIKGPGSNYPYSDIKIKNKKISQIVISPHEKNPLHGRVKHISLKEFGELIVEKSDDLSKDVAEHLAMWQERKPGLSENEI